jgi:iron(III) transport system permease protein
VLRGVTLPVIRPAMVSGGLLVALYVLSDYGAVAVVRFDALTRVIFTSYESLFDRTPAAILSLLLVAMTGAIVAAESRLRGRAGYARVGSGASRSVRPAGLGRWRVPAAAALWGLVAFALGFPLGALGYRLIEGTSRGLDHAALASAAGWTLWVSLLGAVAVVALATPVGVLAARWPSRTSRRVEQATYLVHALPGVVVGLSLVFLGIRVLPGLYQRTPMLVLAYVVLFLPLAVGAVKSSVGQSSASLEEVARSLGARPAEVLRRVTLPLAVPGIAAGAALAMLACAKELTATLLLRPIGAETLATELWAQTSLARWSAAAPYAAVLIAVAAVPTWLLVRASGALGEPADRAVPVPEPASGAADGVGATADAALATVAPPLDPTHPGPTHPGPTTGPAGDRR